MVLGHFLSLKATVFFRKSNQKNFALWEENHLIPEWKLSRISSTPNSYSDTNNETITWRVHEVKQK